MIVEFRPVEGRESLNFLFADHHGLDDQVRLASPLASRRKNYDSGRLVWHIGPQPSHWPEDRGVPSARVRDRLALLTRPCRSNMAWMVLRAGTFTACGCLAMFQFISTSAAPFLSSIAPGKHTAIQALGGVRRL